MFQAGSAYVQIMPSMRGFQQQMTRGMTAPAAAAGRNLTRGVGAAAAAAAPAAMVPVQRTITNRIGGAARAATASVAGSFRAMGSQATASMAGATGAAAGMTGQLRSMARMAGGLVAAVGLYQLGRSAVSSATDIEKSRAALTGLYGNAQQADQMLRRLRDIARESPIEYSAFVSAAESLAYMGIEGDRAVTVLQRIETAMVASGKGGEAFNQVSEAMLAMVNQGKASADEINRMSQAGFPAWEMLAEHMQMSIADVRKAVESGEIGIDQMVAAMEAGAGPTFQKMIAAQQEGARTLSATWARVKDNVVVSLGEMTAPLVARLTPAISRAGQALTGAFTQAPRLFGQLRDAVVSSGVAAAVANIARGVRDLARGALPALRPLVTTVAGAFAALVLALNPLGDLMSWVGGLMGDNTAVVEYLGAALGGMVTAVIAIRVATAAWAVVQSVLNTVMAANPIGLVVVALAALVAGVVYAYRNFETFRGIVDGALRAVGAAGQWLWGVLRPVFDAIGAGWRLLVEGLRRYWDGVLRPVWNAVAAAAQWLWGTILRPVFDGIGAGWRRLGDGIGWVWNNVIRPAWDALVGGLNWVRDRFRDIVGAIGRIWDGLRGALAKPVNFMINTVWNGGILRAWNRVREWIPGLPVAKPLDPIRFATGGQVPGEGSRDTVPALLTPGEFVVRKQVAEPTARFLAALNAGQAEAIQAAGGRWARFQSGGAVQGGRALLWARAQHGKPYIWGGVGPRGYDCSGFMSAIANVLMNRYPHRRLGTTATAPWPGWARGLTSAFGVGYFKGSPGHMAGTLGGRNVEAGGSPSMTKFVQQAAGATHRQFRGHMSLPQIGGRFVGGGGGGGFNPIPGIIRRIVESITNPLLAMLPAPPPQWNGLPKGIATMWRDKALDFFLSQADDGGWLHPGWNLTYNGTRRPEPVLTDAQWRDISRAARGDDRASRDVNLNIYGDFVDPVDVDMLMQRVSFASRSASFG